MSATEEPEKLYAAREPVFPKRVSGRFRNLKWVILLVTLGIYYITPWIPLGPRPGTARPGGPAGPREPAILLLLDRDLAARVLFRRGALDHGGPWPVPVSPRRSGGVWCGYSCPQTVWTDLFFTVERWIEGDRKRAAAPCGERQVGLPQMAAAPVEMGGLAADLGRDRRGMGVLFRRRSDAAGAAGDGAGRDGRLCDGRHF